MQLSKECLFLPNLTSLRGKTIGEFHHEEVPLFNNRMSAFYHDTSFATYTKRKEFQKLALKSLKSKYTDLETQSRIKYNASLKRETNEKWQFIKKSALKDDLNLRVLAEKSAVKIQKVVRGFLSRIKYENYILEVRNLRTNFLIQESQNISNVCLFHLGFSTDSAAKKLQKGIKGYVLRLKILKVIDLYREFVEEKTKTASDEIRKFLLVQCCKEKLKTLSFLIYRSKRLIEIRENLALLSLKRFWRKRKLSYRIIKDKLLRLKRKKTALATKEAYQKLLTTTGPKPTKSPVTKSFTKTTLLDYEEEDQETMPENPEPLPTVNQAEIEAAEQKRREEALALQEKIFQAKRAYGLHDLKDKVVIPYLQERELNENVSNSLEVHLFETTASVYKKAALANRFYLPKVRNTIICSSPEAHHKRFQSGSCILPPLLLIPSEYTSKASPIKLPSEIIEASFMSTTKTCKHRGSPLDSIEKPQKKKNLSLEYRFMQETTISNSLKKSEKIKKIMPKKWVLGRRNSEYTPGLENSNFEPKKWKPIQLDKSILETNPSTNYERSHHRGSSNPMSIVSFSSGIMIKNKRWSIDQISNMPSSYEGSTDAIHYD